MDSRIQKFLSNFWFYSISRTRGKKIKGSKTRGCLEPQKWGGPVEVRTVPVLRVYWGGLRPPPRKIVGWCTSDCPGSEIPIASIEIQALNMPGGKNNTRRPHKKKGLSPPHNDFDLVFGDRGAGSEGRLGSIDGASHRVTRGREGWRGLAAGRRTETIWGGIEPHSPLPPPKKKSSQMNCPPPHFPWGEMVR